MKPDHERLRFYGIGSPIISGNTNTLTAMIAEKIAAILEDGRDFLHPALPARRCSGDQTLLRHTRKTVGAGKS